MNRFHRRTLGRCYLASGRMKMRLGRLLMRLARFLRETDDPDSYAARQARVTRRVLKLAGAVAFWGWVWTHQAWRSVAIGAIVGYGLGRLAEFLRERYGAKASTELR